MRRTAGQSLLYATVYSSLFSACFGYLILLTVVPGGPLSFVARFLSWRWFHPLSQLSYSTYLVHQAFAWVMYLRFKPPPARGLLDHLP